MAKKKKGKRGRPPVHGGYSLEVQDDILKKHPAVRVYLRDTRAGLIRDVAGSEKDPSEQQRLLIDRIISKLLILRIIELWIEKHGVWDRSKLLAKPSVLSLEPALGLNYLAFSNSIDRALKMLGLEKKAIEGDNWSYIEEFDKRKAEKAKANDKTS